MVYMKLFQNHSVKLCWATVQIHVTHTVKLKWKLHGTTTDTSWKLRQCGHFKETLKNYYFLFFCQGHFKDTSLARAFLGLKINNGDCVHFGRHLMYCLCDTVSDTSVPICRRFGLSKFDVCPL